ncbi:hypothetical protein K435DRAFT_860947 [Dendrothele bispora CBS 962.96]|uniref:Uncharacterized protein n=1 Tax=Dendrothele bispora (strain CBS 962.96) TaxID=1314807 RepID=A0A4S8LX12_DENBC|nr:hypothetical protein K435DRAFT_860947 [Dendrothele bispora CBS 962.96]
MVSLRKLVILRLYRRILINTSFKEKGEEDEEMEDEDGSGQHRDEDTREVVDFTIFPDALDEQHLWTSLDFRGWK